MKNIFIRLEYEEALEGKKEFLSSQLNILELLKKLRDYKNLRKRELILKEKFKKELSSIKTKIKELQEVFPKEAAEEEIKISEESYREKEERKSIEEQLEDIKEKLVNLNQKTNGI